VEAVRNEGAVEGAPERLGRDLVVVGLVPQDCVEVAEVGVLGLQREADADHATSVPRRLAGVRYNRRPMSDAARLLRDVDPLQSDSPEEWDRLIEAMGVASLLVVIEQRMGTRLRRSAQPEDVLQDALLHAWRDRAKCEWRGLASYRSWFLSVIDHRLRDLAERESRLKRGGDFSILRESDSTAHGEAARFLERLASTTPSRVAAFREQAQAMRSALAQLPDELEPVVRLRLFEELTSEEVADRLGLGLSAVKHRFRKGSRMYARLLRQALASGSEVQRPDR